MIKRRAIMGIGTVLLVIGLAGLGLLQTGVIYPPAPAGNLSLPEVRPPEPAQGSGQQAAGPPGAPAQQPAPSPPSAQAPLAGSAQAPSAGAWPQPGAGGETGRQAAEPGLRAPGAAATPSGKPAPVPQQARKGGRPYPSPGPERFVKPRTSATQPKAGPKSAGGPGSQGLKSKFEEKRLKARLKAESKRYAAKSAPKPQVRKSGSRSYVRAASAARTGRRRTGPVVIKFTFNPAQNRRIDVARVHQGDKIRVKVQRVGQVDRRVRFTFSNDLRSPQGAVLMLETTYPFEHAAYRPYRGYYKVEIKIYPGNRWNIMPRSFV